MTFHVKRQDPGDYDDPRSCRHCIYFTFNRECGCRTCSNSESDNFGMTAAYIDGAGCDEFENKEG